MGDWPEEKDCMRAMDNADCYESALYRLEGGSIGDFYEFFTEELAGEEIP